MHEQNSREIKNSAFPSNCKFYKIHNTKEKNVWEKTIRLKYQVTKENLQRALQETFDSNFEQWDAELLLLMLQ